MRNNSENTARLKHLGLLVNYIKSTHMSVTKSLDSLLPTGEITFDLLQAVFKPDSEVYTICPGTQEPTCFIFNHGEVRESDDSKTFFIEARCIDFDGKRFGEAKLTRSIPIFPGMKRIDSLEAYPLRFHAQAERIRKKLVKRGRKFCSLGDVFNLNYAGRAFYALEEGEVASRYVKSRIIVDAAYFEKMNPSYPATRVRKADKGVIGRFGHQSDGRVRYDHLKPNEMKDREFLVCSPSVLGFSLDDKLFREFILHLAQLCLY